MTANGGQGMGMMYAHNQQQAARHPVRVLGENGGRVHYSRFYDGTEETAARLYAGMGVDAGEGEWIGAEGVMDEAAAEMQAQGYVTLEWHAGEVLADGEPAYSIVLTEDGRRRLAAGQVPKFRDLNL